MRGPGAHTCRSTLVHHHIEGLEDELGSQVRLYGPSHHPSTPGVDDDGKVEEARGRGDIGDVSHPEFVRPGGTEVAMYQVRRRLGFSVPRGRAPLLPPCDADESGPRHETAHPLGVHEEALVPEFGIHPRTAVALAAEGVDSPHLLDETCMGDLSPRYRTRKPSVGSAGGEAQHTAHRSDREFGLVMLHELESRSGIDPLFRANQAAAFFRISRSTRS
jgi:hypothetical protein